MENNDKNRPQDEASRLRSRTSDENHESQVPERSRRAGSEASQEEREFPITKWSLSNRTSVFVLIAIIVIAGLSAYVAMPREAFPEVVTPEIYVGTPYPGNSPTDIEKLITRPIEKELKSITGIDEINSTSIMGYSSIQVKFDFSVSPEEALRKVKDKVDIAKGDPDFPKDLPAEPNVFEMNFSELMPIMNINLSGDYTLDQLKEYGEYLEDRIEDLPQISKVEIRGVQEKEVRVNLNTFQMEAREVSFGDVAQAIQQENVTISGGDLLVNDYRRTVRVIGELENFQNFEDIIVKHEKGNIVYLRDIATVEFDEKEKESYARQYLQPVVMLDVMKRSGENLIEASERINEIVEGAQKTEFPSNLEISITGDQSDQTSTQVAELENSIIFGMILVVAVLMFFLGLRNALFVGVAIPMSMLLSFLLLGSTGVTLNTMVLFSLVLALGMLVDNAIVVVENIYRLMDEGMPRLQAARQGASEVAWAIIASTATTLAAFIPLAMWPGMIGEFMFYLPVTLMIVLGSSLFVALVINPVLTGVFMKIKEDPIEVKNSRFIAAMVVIAVALVLDVATDAVYPGTHPIAGVLISGSLLYILGSYIFVATKEGARKSLMPGIALLVFGVVGFLLGQNVSGNFLGITGSFLLANAFIIFPMSGRFQNNFLPRLERAYDGFIAWALRGKTPYQLLAGTFALLVVAMGLIANFTPKVLFFPENEPQYLNIYIENPIGTDIERTNEVTLQVEKTVIKTLKKYEMLDASGEKEDFLVESVIGQVGEGTSDPMQGPSMGQTPHKARITVSFVKFQERRGIETNQVLSEIRDAIRIFPGVQITVSKNQAGPPQGAPINIEIEGDDYVALMDEAVRMQRFIEDGNIPGIEDLKLDVEQGQPEMPIIIDRDKARRLGLSTYSIGDAIRTALFGKEVSTYKEGEDDYAINLRFNQDYRYDIDAIMNQRITFRDMASGRIVQVPISAVASTKLSSTFSAVKRRDLNRVITISSNTLEGYNPTEVVNSIKKHLERYEVAEGHKFSFTGQQEEQAKEMSFLTTALAIAFVLIIFIIVLQFNSISTPFIIGGSVLFSLIGVLLGLVVFQMDFVIIMTMIGIISLAGIVVNNAIVLIDYTELLAARRKEELGMGEDERLPLKTLVELIEEGGKTRLRPVLLTAITTILGLLPLAVGFNIDFFGLFMDLNPNIYIGGDNVMFWGPMSWTIIFGLTFATFLTLVIVPVMYFIIQRFKYPKEARSLE